MEFEHQKRFDSADAEGMWALSKKPLWDGRAEVQRIARQSAHRTIPLMRDSGIQLYPSDSGIDLTSVRSLYETNSLDRYRPSLN